MNQNNKSVLVYLSHSSATGGASKVIESVINSLAGEFNFEIITTNEYDEKEFQSNHRFDVLCPINSFNYRRSKSYPEFFNYFWKVPVCFVRYLHLLRKNKPDISLSFVELENIVNLLCRPFNSSTKAIISFRTSPVSATFPVYFQLFYKVLVYLSKYLADLIIVNSEDVKRILVNQFGIVESKISVIYNPKDITSIHKCASEELTESFFNTTEPILINVGRLSDQKGQWHLLRVFSQIIKTTPARLVICGDGPLDSYLKSLTKELCIEDSVLFTGWCENPHKYVSKSTVFVLSSLYEGLPNALIEALICGCPSVSSDCKTGPAELLENGKYGLLSQDLDGIKYDANAPLSESERDLYEKILLLLNDTELQEKFRVRSKERALLFEKDGRMKEYADAFNSVL